MLRKTLCRDTENILARCLKIRPFGCSAYLTPLEAIMHALPTANIHLHIHSFDVSEVRSNMATQGAYQLRNSYPSEFTTSGPSGRITVVFHIGEIYLYTSIKSNCV
jgi:hypothetical protein